MIKYPVEHRVTVSLALASGLLSALTAIRPAGFTQSGTPEAEFRGVVDGKCPQARDVLVHIRSVEIGVANALVTFVYDVEA